MREIIPDGTVDADTPETLRAKIAKECGMNALDIKTMNQQLFKIPTNEHSLTPGTKAYEKYTGELAELMESNKDIQARLKNFKISSKDASQAMAKVLGDNFAWAWRNKQWSYNHIIDHHGTEIFTLADAVKANSVNPIIYQSLYRDSKAILMELPNGKYLRLIRGNDEDKVNKAVTSHIISRKYARKILELDGWKII